jgi:hypothetical protein
MNKLFKKIDCLKVETAKKQIKYFIKFGYEQFTFDGRGGYQEDTFYDVFPYIEMEAKTFVASETSKIESTFKIADLAVFVSKLYYEQELGIEFDEGFYVRSETSSRYDLERWGY